MPAFSDDFNRADSGSLGAGWTDAFFFPLEGPADYVSIVSNRARVGDIGGGPNAGARWLTPGAFQNWDISVKVQYSLAGPWLGLIARATANNTFYYAIARSNTAPGLVLRKIVAGVVTQIGTAAITWPAATEKILRLSVQASTLKVFFDGAELISVTDSDISLAGDAGLYSANGGAGTVGDFDDLSATALSAEAFDHIIPLLIRASVSFDSIIPLLLRAAQEFNSQIPISWDLCKIFQSALLGEFKLGESLLGGTMNCLMRADQIIPILYRLRAELDSVIPLLIRREDQQFIDFVIALLIRRLETFDQNVPISWSSVDCWTKQAVSAADAWSKQASAAGDDWTKQAGAAADAWVKQPVTGCD